MAVLVGTHDGLLELGSPGGHDHTLAGRSVDAVTPGPRGSWIAIVDDHAVWQREDGGAWSVLAETDETLVALTTALDVVFAGTASARVLRFDDGELVASPAFDDAPGRSEWHQVGPPIHVRSLAATCDGTTVLANVHVGGILRSDDGGGSWVPTLPVDDDVHEVLAHPTRPEIAVAAAAVGLCRSADGGRTWTVEARGLTSSYARGVAVLDDVVYLSSADGPFAAASTVSRAAVDSGPLTPAGDGLPDEITGMVDTRGLSARDGVVVLASRAGHVWERGRTGTWSPLAADVDGVQCVAVA